MRYTGCSFHHDLFVHGEGSLPLHRDSNAKRSLLAGLVIFLGVVVFPVDSLAQAECPFDSYPPVRADTAGL